MPRITLIAVCWLLGVSAALAGAGSIQPDKPRWGDTLQARYDPATDGASFTVRDSLYVVAFLSYPDRVEQAWWPMELVEDVFVAEIRVGGGLGYVELFFVTPWAWDVRADARSMIYRPDGKPARGARQHAVTELTASENLRLEREMYPENYWVYRDAWMTMWYTRELTGAALRSELDRLEGEEGDLPPDHDFALMYGYLLLDDEPRARAALLEMIEQHPDSALIHRAATDYEYHVFVKSVDGDGPRVVADALHEVVAGQPDTFLARERFEVLAYDSHIPMRTLESIFGAWVKKEPDNPVPYLTLAGALKIRGLDPGRAVDLLWQGVDLALSGKHRLYEDPGGKVVDGTLAYWYEMIAELSLKEGLVAQALAAARAAQDLGPSPGGAQVTEGALWESAGAFRRAEEAYLAAMQNDPELALPSLESLYRRRHGSGDGFADYLVEHAPVAAAAADARHAPDFTVTTLDGLELSSADLRGKVTVINFWFTACGPCIAEMPALNRLVREFADEPVVFLAPTRDEEEPLREFLEGVDFEYRIAADAADLHLAFGIRFYPTHLVIDAEGVIRHERRGGDTTVDHTLRPLIRQALLTVGE